MYFQCISMDCLLTIHCRFLVICIKSKKNCINPYISGDSKNLFTKDLPSPSLVRISSVNGLTRQNRQ